MSDDRSILVAALQSAVTAFRAAYPNPTLLGSGPDRDVLDALSGTIARCAAYQAVAGQMVFSGGSGPVLHSGPLASLLFSKGGWPSENVEGAVDWLLKVLRTRKATVLVKAAIWGMQVDQSVTVRQAQLMPFGTLPDSYMKDRIKSRARSCYDGSAWMTPTYYDLPDAAYIEEVPHFPYIGSDGAAFQRMNDLEERLNDIVVLLQATAAGRPIAVACWFEYLDHDLEYADWENAFSWLLPEVHPKVVRGDVVSAAQVQTNIANFDALPPDRRAAVLRSMERFRLSQGRRQGIDRVLDLTLAFEIAVSGPGGEQSPPSYKVGVRTVQAIGGPLLDRQRWRTTVGELYKLRNQATHGGQLKVKEAKALDRIIDSSGAIYLQLMTRLLTIATAPDWPAIELEALSAP
jgi:hypothetical protein